MTYGSTSRNISILTLSTFVIAIMGLFNTEWFVWSNLLITAVSFYILNILGVWMTMHRYYSHKSFKFRHNFIEKIFLLLALLAGRGSPLGWVYLHRQHHAYSDTEKDPHSPKHLGFKMFGFSHFKKQEENMKLFLIKDLMTKEQIFIHTWYALGLFSFCVLFALTNFTLFYFAWVWPAVIIQISQSVFNYCGHMYGYRNENTTDDSRNCPYLFPLLLGEAWHNNHHAVASSYSTTVKPYEIDPMAWLIKVIQK